MHVFFCVSKNVSVSCAYTQGKREQFSGFNRTLDAINNVFRKFSAFHDETGRLNVDGMNIISNDYTNLSKQQQVSEIMRQMLTQAQTAGQYFTNDQIKEMTRKVSAEVDLVHQQTQNQRYGSSHIGATAKDISNVVTDAASGVV